MLVISRKNGQKVMINDNIVITVVEAKNGSVKLAIDADRDVKIYREEIYYQIKLANLIGKNSSVNTVDSVSNMIKDENLKLNDKFETTPDNSDIIIDKPSSSKSFIIKKKNPNE